MQKAREVRQTSVVLFKRKHVILLVVIALLVGGAGLLLFWPKQAPASPLVAITLSHVNWTNNSRGLGADGWRNDTFWVTNHTDKTLSIRLREVQIQSNGVWTCYSQIPIPGLLYFTNKNRREGLLAPHAEGFGSLLAQRAALPANAIWRVKASVSEKLTGFENIAAAVVNEPRLIEARLKTGNTNIPVNPFRKNVARLGYSSEVVSEVVNPP